MSAGVITKPHPLHNVTTVEHFDTPESSRENSRVSSRRASPSPPSEKSNLTKQGSRKLSFPWSLKKSDSQCSLNHGHKHGWKPVTLSPTVLILFATISLILIAIIEFLAQWSESKGGLAISASPDDFPTYVNFSYQFLPTIVAVIYSLFWSWVDLDAKRMQPWFELSKDSGVTAKNSIFLSYPYDFVGSVPITALRRRHWPTFCSGTVMVLIFWLITPLQSTIFSADLVIITEDVSLSDTSTWVPASDQAMLLDQSVLNEAYAITWLNQPYPDFATSEDTFMPFMPLDRSPQKAQANWTGTTTRYWTDLTCWPAEKEIQGPPARRTYSFNNGRGCNITDITAHPTINPLFPYRMLYFGYQSSPFGDFALANPFCSENSTNQFLSTWARSANTTDNPDAIDLEAIFCETSYHKENVSVTIHPQDGRYQPHEFTPLGPSQPVPITEFNMSAFEHLLSAGVSSVELEVDREYPFGRVLEQWPRTMDLGLTWPMSPMTGFAVGHQKPADLDIFQDQKILEESFRAVHKLMFSVAFHRILDNSTAEARTEGTLATQKAAVVVNRSFSAIVEGLLGLVTILALVLAWLSHVCPSKLTQDVSSLVNLMEICRNSPALLDKLADKGCLTDEELTRLLSTQKLRLLCGCQSKSDEPVIEMMHDEMGSSREVFSACYDLSSSRGHYSPVRPWALRRDVGSTAIVIMTAALVVTIYLKVQEGSFNGLHLGVDNTFVELLILSFVPTIFATLFEPFWVLLNRLLCILQPFRDLWHGQQPAKGSIRARYTSVPPQLVLWRAGKAGHFLLVTLCAIALLSNLLAVGLGGLFESQAVPVDVEQIFTTDYLPQMNLTSIMSLPLLPGNGATFEYAEPFYVMMNNISRGTPFPPWIGDGHFFQPFLADDTQVGQQHTALTRGYGVNASCSVAGRYTTFGVAPVLELTDVWQQNPSASGCPSTVQPELLSLNLTRNRLPSGRSAAETVDTPVFGRVIQPCDTSLILGWSRSSETLDNNGRIDSSFVICQPIFTTAMFEVTVDTDGYVLDSTPVSQAENTLDYEDSSNHTDTMIVVLNHLMKRSSPAPWHNDTLSQDWLNYLLKIQPGKEDLHDPQTDVPNAEDLVPGIEHIYRHLYALLLSFNNAIFDRRTQPLPVNGRSQTTQRRVFMPTAAFGITTAVLGINILAAIVFYGFSIKHFLPRMPTTIGSLLAFVAPSRAVREYVPRDGHAAKDVTFSFGRYVGDDGRAHVGIEMDPYVVPVSLASLKKGDTRPAGLGLRRVVTGKPGLKRGDTWL